MALLVPTLLYHAIDKDTCLSKIIGKPASSRYVLDKKKFFHQIHYLFENGFTTITLAELFNKEKCSSFHKSVILTFDDGYISDLEHVLPVLKECKFGAYLFVCPSLIGRPGYLGWSDVKYLSSEFVIGSHGKKHIPLTHLSPAELVYEIEGSRKDLEDQLGTTVDIFSAPHGAYDLRVASMLQKAGYRYVFTSDPFPITAQCNPYYLGRFPIWRNTSDRKFVRLANMNNTVLFWERMVFKLKERLKQKINAWRRKD